jgi:hypothetical protein
MIKLQVETAVDRAFGRIFDRNHAKIGGACLGGAKHRVDRFTRQAFDGVPELLVHRLFAEGARWSQISDRDALFQRAAGRHDFAEDGLHIEVDQGSGVALGDAAQDLRLAFGPEHGRHGFCLDVAHLLRQARALVQ